MFLEKLADLITSFWDIVSPFVVIYQYEGGVLLRFGLYKKTLGPGFHWKWPLMEVVETARTVTTTIDLNSQTLTTMDGKQVVISSVIKYRVRDVKPFLLEISEAEDALNDVSMGTIKTTVSNLNIDQLDQIESLSLEKVRKEVNQYGFKILSLTLIDCAQIRSIRLITDSWGGDE